MSTVTDPEQSGLQDHDGEPIRLEQDDARQDGSATAEAETTSTSDIAEPSAAADAGDDDVDHLEKEGDVAADYIEELLDITDLDGDIDIEVRDGRTYVSVVTDEGEDRLRALVGKDGRGLDALQELTRLAVLSSTGRRSRLVLDIVGHREERAGQLQSLAEDAIARVGDGGGPVHLEPMGSYERKLVHDAVAEAGLVSGSEGEGSRRHVVVSAGE